MVSEQGGFEGAQIGATALAVFVAEAWRRRVPPDLNRGFFGGSPGEIGVSPDRTGEMEGG